MDVLDLSLGEKKSRRKTNMPMRRQGLENANSKEDVQKVVNQADGASNENGDNLDGDKFEKVKSENLEEKIILSRQKDAGETRLYEEGEKSLSASNDSAKFYCSTPSDEEKDGNERCFTGNETPNSLDSDNQSLATSPNGSAISYHSNVNNNNSGHVRPLTRFTHLPSNVVMTNLSNTHSNLSAFQERLASFSSNTQSRLGSTIKPSTRVPYTPYDVQPIDTPGIPERTKKQNRWAFNVWREWARKRNLSVRAFIYIFCKKCKIKFAFSLTTVTWCGSCYNLLPLMRDTRILEFAIDEHLGVCSCADQPHCDKNESSQIFDHFGMKRICLRLISFVPISCQG